MLTRCGTSQATNNLSFGRYLVTASNLLSAGRAFGSAHSMRPCIGRSCTSRNDAGDPTYDHGRNHRPCCCSPLGGPCRIVVQRLDRHHGTFSVYLGDRLGYYQALANHGVQPQRNSPFAPTPTSDTPANGSSNRRPPDPRRRRYRRSADPAISLPEGHVEALTDRDSLSYMTPLIRLTAGIVTRDARPDGGIPHRRRRSVSGLRCGHSRRDRRHESGDVHQPTCQ